MNELRLNNILFIIIIAMLAIMMYKLYNKQENLTLSEEAVQNIASVYAEKDKTVTFNNVKITGALEVDGVSNLIGGANSGGTLTAGKFTANNCYVGTINASGDIGTTGSLTATNITASNDIIASNATITLANGNIGINGNISANGVSANSVTIQGQPAMREQTSYRENYYGGHNDTHVYYAYPTT
jgi:hypothetical protein